MQIAKVIGTVVSTQKNKKFEGAKLMLVQPLNLDDSPRGNALLAIDGVGAGVDEKVLVVRRPRGGRGARQERRAGGRRHRRHHRYGFDRRRLKTETDVR
jgi:microcompartment protein CcmK/EutM